MRRTLYSRRQIALWGGLLLAILLPVFIHLGLWQLGKAEAGHTRQAELDARGGEAPAAMPGRPATAEQLRHRRFELRGEYEAGRQVLIDNRVHDRLGAGYHVITPLRLAGSDTRVLVNRGWIPAAADRRDIPAAPVPSGPVEVTGVAVVPGERFFTLGPEAAASPGSPAIWQNLDLGRFRNELGEPLQPVVIRLDPGAPGGFVRDWPRADDRVDRHLGYALQWFGFALASAGIWAFFLLRRP